MTQEFTIGDQEDELVPVNHGPFGDYYVPQSNVNRSIELRAALKASSQVSSSYYLKLKDLYANRLR